MRLGKSRSTTSRSLPELRQERDCASEAVMDWVVAVAMLALAGWLIVKILKG